jgi:hypothetical protein
VRYSAANETTSAARETTSEIRRTVSSSNRRQETLTDPERGRRRANAATELGLALDDSVAALSS